MKKMSHHNAHVQYTLINSSTKESVTNINHCSPVNIPPKYLNQIDSTVRYWQSKSQWIF